MLGFLSCASEGAAALVSAVATVSNAKAHVMRCLFTMHPPLLVCSSSFVGWFIVHFLSPAGEGGQLRACDERGPMKRSPSSRLRRLTQDSDLTGNDFPCIAVIARHANRAILDLIKEPNRGRRGFPEGCGGNAEPRRTGEAGGGTGIPCYAKLQTQTGGKCSRCELRLLPSHQIFIITVWVIAELITHN